MQEANIAVSPNSRYKNTPLYVNAKGIKFWGLWERISFPPRSDDRYLQISNLDWNHRLDLISYQFYGDPNMWWVIAEANNLMNPLEDMAPSARSAKSPVVYSSGTPQPCFRMHSLRESKVYNSGGVQELTAKVFLDALEIYVAGEMKERKEDLTLYPYFEDGSADPNFWGFVSSSWVSVEWLSPNTIRPTESLDVPEAPTPPNCKIYYFHGGADCVRTMLRIPSLQHVHSKL